MQCECGKKVVARRMCSGHYQQWLKSPEGQANKNKHGLSPIQRVRRAPKTASGTCVLWDGATASGYGVITVARKNQSVPRIVLEEKLGRRLYGKALHTCNTKRCVAPAHIYEGTTGQNSVDAYDDEASPSGERHHWSTVSDCDVIEMRVLRAEGLSLKELSRRYRVAESTVSRICNGKRRAAALPAYRKKR